MNNLIVPRTLSVAIVALALSACGGDDDSDDINALEGRVDSLETSIDSLESENSTLSDSVDALETENTTLSDSLAALEARLDALEDLESRVESIETSIASLESEDASLSESLEAIEARIDTLDETDAATDLEIAEISDDLDELESRLNGLTGFYQVVLVNATANQPIAPTAVALHSDAYYAWDIGAPASVGLEILAESGSPVSFIDELGFALDSTYTQDGPIAPGDSRIVYVEAVWSPDLSITIAGMPVNTNDAFAGTTGWNISSLAAGSSTNALLPIYDAGTEANTESSATVPGPAAGGEGYNPARDDRADYVARHQGVVTADDGLASSALDQSHRFDQGALYVTITRVSN